MKSAIEINEIRNIFKDEVSQYTNGSIARILVGVATCGVAAGAQSVISEFEEQLNNLALSEIAVTQTGCIGVCDLEPIVDVIMPGENKVTYVRMTPEKVKKVVDQHIKNGNVVEEYTVNSTLDKLRAKKHTDFSSTKLDDVDFFKKQKRITLKNCGIINPESIDEYIALDGYKALEKSITEMTPEEVVNIVKNSGLRGRGGGGFPTGLKWEFTAKAENDKKYVVCNADEGDPGAFMDRSILEGDPQSILEAMAIAGYAIGSDKGYIYKSRISNGCKALRKSYISS